MTDDLVAITCFFSYAKNSRAAQVHKQFKENLEKQKVKLYTIELAFFDEDFLLEDTYLQLRTATVLWHKEALLNILVSRLPPHVKKIAWLDSDIFIEDDDWAKKLSRELDHYKIVQLGRKHFYLTPEGKVERDHMTLGYGLRNDIGEWSNYAKYHPGLGWAASRELFTHHGGLFEYGLSGGADGMMGYIFGNGARNGSKDMKDWIVPRKYQTYQKHNLSMIDKLRDYRDMVVPYVDGSVSYLDTKVLHRYHAPQSRRGYLSRPSVLNGINLHKDVAKDQNGLFKWTNMRYNLVFEEFFSMKDKQEGLTKNISYEKINIENIL